MNIRELKKDLAESNKNLPLVMSIDSEGNNYYRIKGITKGFYTPSCEWSGTFLKSDSASEHTETKKAIMFETISNNSEDSGITSNELLHLINALSLDDDTYVIISKGNEGSPYTGYCESYYNRDTSSWGQASIYDEEELTEEYLLEKELDKDKMPFSIVFFPVN